MKRAVTKCLIEPVDTGYMLTFTREYPEGGASSWTITVRTMRLLFEWLRRELT